MGSKISEIVKNAKGADVSLVRFLYCENNGIIRGKVITLTQLNNCIKDGIGHPINAMAVNSFDEPQPVSSMESVGEIRLIPDPTSFVALPYAPHNALMLCDMLTINHDLWGGCPRSFLKNMVKLAASKNLYLSASFEPEFYLTKRDTSNDYIPIDSSPYCSTIALAYAATFIKDLVIALQSQGIVVEKCHAEQGDGQYEISIRHENALLAADNQLKLRETIRCIALKHELIASLAPKPFLNQAGSGAHIHFSLWNTKDGKKRNLFYEPRIKSNSKTINSTLSKIGQQFMAGVIEHLPALLALTCPSVNSYRRLAPDSWSGAFIAWGNDNRKVALRVPSTFLNDMEGTTNIELKTADNSCNPYLALGGLIAAGLDGINRRACLRL